ncbi:phenoloxidase 8-like [Uranotaenia lowii]|uniref:phenoloxidase 8-like n=1 Tax=Uranotaenia lowii TaxID=190385 RepID=UPI0024788C04|nr:phenoloxidase 8-like [Uranotaenia lowii]
MYYDLPEHYLADRYKAIGQYLGERFGADVEAHVAVKDVGTPDIDFAKKIPRHGNFTPLCKSHGEIATELIQLFLDQPDPDTLLGLAAYCRPRLNPELFQYCLCVALQHRDDSRDVPIPMAIETFPQKFVDATVLSELREEANAVEQGNRISIEVPPNFTADDREPEQKVAYFREDIGFNLHHWHWHLVYPPFGPRSVVDKDRHGELFYYMHTQMLAHYNNNRFCNGLERVVPLENLRETIKVAYFPKLMNGSVNRTYPARYENMTLKDVNRDDFFLFLTVEDQEIFLKRITAAIDAGFVELPDGSKQSLKNKKGIDTLGNIIESSALSVNDFYGNVHNDVHMLLSFIHDPEGLYMESYGVMADTSISARDPIFFRWHTMIDELCWRHKNTLDPYAEKDLLFLGVEVIQLQTLLQGTGPAPRENTLMTFWQRTQFNLGTGLDFNPTGDSFVTFTHLQHTPFTFRLQVRNSFSSPRQGTVRLYLIPTTDADGSNLGLKDRRRYAMELDSFKVVLQPGLTNIVRRSENSSVTIPYERTFRNIQQSALTGDQGFRFCNCGWPDHLLIPKGTPTGTNYDLFAMVSDYDKDFVLNFDENLNCNDSHSFCGLRDAKYPDAQNMGFPLDRKFPLEVKELDDFVKKYPNMRSTKVQIKFTNTVIART